MDMSGMDMDSPAANLSLDDPMCVQAAEACIAFYAAENASQEAVPFASQFNYGHWTVYYYVGILGLLLLYHLAQTVRYQHLQRAKTAPVASRTSKPSIIARLQASARFIFYRQFSQPRGSLGLPAYGTMAFLVVTIVFLTAMVFAQRPYYRYHFGYGSPPIAIRTGLMAFACIPILIALAGKVNIVTLLTGISHERLNVLHRWVAWFSFVLSLIHAIPFFVASYYDPGWGGSARVKSEFYRYGASSGASEYSGVPPLAILFALCVMSLPQIRQRCYETFYAFHILLAITYVGLLFWHSMYQGVGVLDSWDYLWATIAVWLASWLARLFVKTQPLNIRNTWFESSRATLTALPGDVTRIEVWPPASFRWKPAQHVFLRFVSLAPLDNHPFTIASADASLTNDQDAQRGNPLVFLARSHKGFTNKLLSHAGKGDVTTKVWVDGPYGGIHTPIALIYDHIILLAGGTGITSCLPWLRDTVAKARAGHPVRTRKVSLIWVMRHAHNVSWVEEELSAALRAEASNLDVSGSFFVTHSDVEPSTQTGFVDDGEKGGATISKTSSRSSDETKLSALGAVQSGRPVIADFLARTIAAGEKTVVFGCGPEDMRITIANAVAAEQRRVMRGECMEIAMHLETFGW